MGLFQQISIIAPTYDYILALLLLSIWAFIQKRIQQLNIHPKPRLCALYLMPAAPLCPCGALSKGGVSPQNTNVKRYQCKDLSIYLKIYYHAPPRQTHRTPLLPHFGHLPLLDGQHLPGRLRRAPAPRLLP